MTSLKAKTFVSKVDDAKSLATDWKAVAADIKNAMATAFREKHENEDADEPLSGSTDISEASANQT